MGEGADDFDARLRREAQTWLTVRTQDGQRSLHRDELEDFAIDGRPFKLMDRQRGIRKPRELTAALSIRTTYTAEGRARPYDDTLGPDGLLRYKWRGDEPDHAENVALRVAHHRRVPLVWFFGVGPSVYQPVFPVYLVDEERDRQQFVVAQDVTRIAAVRNGLALCKIHHAAYDRHILGIRPDYTVEIHHRLLAEIDGPMLRYGLQEHHGRPLMTIPRVRAERPDPHRLGQRYALFRQA